MVWVSAIDDSHEAEGRFDGEFLHRLGLVGFGQGFLGESRVKYANDQPVDP
ncbi:hypothetical protein WCLP8_3630003 [uncultured Gammaproteobacteria bacterium]